MKNIVISDTALIGKTYDETLDGLEYLKYLQEQKNRLILLSNKLESNAYKIGIYTFLRRSMESEKSPYFTEDNKGLEVTLFDDDRLLRLFNYKLDYTILGNGIKAFDGDNNLIYQGKFLEKEQLESMVKIFNRHTYLSSDIESIEDKDTYKFMTLDGDTDKVTDNVFGMNCSNRSYIMNSIIVSEMQAENPFVVGYNMEDKPYFYQKEVNKLTAFKEILKSNPDIDINQTIFILNELTDKPILEEYADLSYSLNNRLVTEKEYNKADSLAKVLEKIR